MQCRDEQGAGYSCAKGSSFIWGVKQGTKKKGHLPHRLVSRIRPIFFLSVVYIALLTCPWVFIFCCGRRYLLQWLLQQPSLDIWEWVRKYWCMMKSYRMIQCHLRVNHLVKPVLWPFSTYLSKEAELITCSSPNRRIYKGNVILSRYSAQYWPQCSWCGFKLNSCSSLKVHFFS